MSTFVIILGLVALGALISLGNERQRNALDSLRRQAEQWAMNDLRLKRGQMTQRTDIFYPTGWLAAATSKVLETRVDLRINNNYEEPIAVSYQDGESGKEFVYSLVPPKDAKKFSKRKRSHLSSATSHPFARLRKNSVDIVEMNILNAGIVFDVELPIAWQKISKETTDSDHLWLYIFA